MKKDKLYAEDESLYSTMDEIKDEITEKDNNLKYLKMRSLLQKMGYQKRSKRINKMIKNFCKEHNLIIEHDGRKKEGIENIPFDDYITFKYRETKGDGKFYYKNAGKINVASGQNPIDLYYHQAEAIKKLKKIDKQGSFSGIVAIPTGGGKTLMAMYWLLQNAINKHKKVLWIAHRHELLSQAFISLRDNSYENLVSKRKSFTYRIISGKHDKPINIKPGDDFLIASKDSLYRNMEYLKNQWVEDLNEAYMVVDEAHHAPAKTYREVINGLDDNVEKFKLLGLTATPFRTGEKEKGLLKKVFEDDIIYKTDLESLINRDILSKPEFEEVNTDINMDEKLSREDINKIKTFDLHSDVAKKIAQNKTRNKMIVDRYVKNRKKYDKLLVYVIDIKHAISLAQLFQDRGVNAEFIVSSLKDMKNLTSITAEENEKKIKKFRNDECEVLVNVNILTEGVDLPNAQTVFLTRPTISSILMTQMIGRGLRGSKAGGTEEAYIVSFLDDWKDKINWANPESLHIRDTEPEDEKPSERAKVKLISVNKIQEFASIMDETVDTDKLEKVEYKKRLPLGFYHFSVLIPGKEEDDAIEKSCEILVYEDMKENYDEFIESLPNLFAYYEVENEEDLDRGLLEEMSDEIEKNYFLGYDMIPDYNRQDIEDIIRYYAETEEKPPFINFEERDKYDISKIAEEIIEKDMGPKQKGKYVEKRWENEDTPWSVFFQGNKRYFLKQLDIEISKIIHPESWESEKPSVNYEIRDVEDLSMSEIFDKDKKVWRDIRDEVYERHKDEDGYYVCVETGYKSKKKVDFHIDHINPRDKKGKTKAENLQLLKKDVNLRLGTKD